MPTLEHRLHVGVNVSVDGRQAMAGFTVSTNGATSARARVVPDRLEAKVGIERWRRHYNEVRQDMSLGYQTPAEFKATLSEKRSPAPPARADQEEHGDDRPATGAILQ